MLRMSAAIFLLSSILFTDSRGDFVTGQVNVDGKANLYGAGLNSPPGGSGLLPVLIDIPATAQYVEFSATGNVSLDILDPNTRPFYGPDGGTFPLAASGFTNISSLGGISGIRYDFNTFLAGVFVSDTLLPASPAIVDYGVGNMATFSPALQQSFFVGDGFTGTGSGTTQRFFVPVGATRLYLGLVDGFDPLTSTISGLPNFYDDNGGSYQVAYSISVTAVPEPTMLFLVGLGSSCVVAKASRRRLAAAKTRWLEPIRDAIASTLLRSFRVECEHR